MRELCEPSSRQDSRIHARRALSSLVGAFTAGQCGYRQPHASKVSAGVDEKSHWLPIGVVGRSRWSLRGRRCGFSFTVVVVALVWVIRTTAT